MCGGRESNSERLTWKQCGEAEKSERLCWGVACLRESECQERGLPLTRSQQVSLSAETFSSLEAAFDIHLNRDLTDRQRLWGPLRPGFQYLFI